MNESDHRTFTAMHEVRNVQTVKLVLEFKADINALSVFGSPLYMAVVRSSTVN